MTGPVIIFIGIAGGIGAIFIVDFARKWCKKDSCTAMMWGALVLYLALVVFVASGF